MCGEERVSVYSTQAQQFEWRGFGLKLSIQEGSLPAGVKQCTIDIKASLSGQYEFPEDYHLVGAVFWFRCETVREFVKPITIEIQHCAKTSKLSFVRSSCRQKQLPYTFKQLGDLTSHNSYGVTELTSFSGVALTQQGTNERNYLAKLLTKEVKRRVAPVIVEIFFVITWNTDAHQTVS